jgi:hypothetical protein
MKFKSFIEYVNQEYKNWELLKEDEILKYSRHKKIKIVFSDGSKAVFVRRLKK